MCDEFGNENVIVITYYFAINIELMVQLFYDSPLHRSSGEVIFNTSQTSMFSGSECIHGVFHAQISYDHKHQ